MKLSFAAPLVVFAAMAGLLFFGLHRDPGLVASPLLDQPLPDFVMSEVRDPDSQLRSDELTGEPALLNVWASWCPPCLAEHPLLMSVTDEVRIFGLNYKDERDDAVQWLDRYGDPYTRSGHDPDGRVALDLGVYGVPETFVIDRNGRIVHKHTGPISVKEWAHTFRPLIQRLKDASD
ncbi:MAG: DsbE family thiol:disulfide interchange protein [Immundisolibacterales bacterium]|nr:DsbE family thiol:disulfide interchange protein [Immundisolibacterales bacterium]